MEPQKATTANIYIYIYIYSSIYATLDARYELHTGPSQTPGQDKGKTWLPHCVTVYTYHLSLLSPSPWFLVSARVCAPGCSDCRCGPSARKREK